MKTFRFSRLVRSVSAIGLALATTLAVTPQASAQVCTTNSLSFAESFDNTTYRDTDNTSAAGWGVTGTLKLALKGNSFNTSSGNTSEKIFVVGAADFDGDGWIDMAAVMLSPDRLHFLKNLGINADGSHKGFSTGGAVNSAGWNAQIIDNNIPDFNASSPALFAGDLDADGDSDIFYLKTGTQDNAGSVIRAFVWRLDNVVAGIPKFTRIELTSHFVANRVSWHWTSTFAQLIDWNKDGRADLITNSSYGSTNEILLFKATTTGIGFENPVKLIANTGFAPPFADAGTLNTATGGALCVPPNLTGTFKSRGGTAIAVNDFDGDGDFDIIAGSMSEKNLKFWKNDGADVFTQQPDITFSKGGATFVVTGDLDGDGDQDIVVGRDGYNCGGAGGDAYYFANSGSGAFSMRAAPILSTGADADFGAAFYIDENIKYPNLNKFPDKTVDIIAADGNDSGQYSQVLGSRLNVYNLAGIATSTVIDALDNQNNAIVEVQMSGLDAVVSPPATTITYYVSNDGGANWEKLDTDEVGNPGNTHTFTHFGSDFRWKAELGAAQSTLTGEEANFAPGSKNTPELRSVSWRYGYVLRREYSRSALAFADQVSTDLTTKQDLVISSTFFYPGYEGSLRAFNTKQDQLVASSEPNNDLNLKVNKTSSVVWDAAALLKGRAGTDRTIYTALPNSSGVINQRVGFTSGNAATLSTYMATDLATTQAVITFIRNGMGHVTGNKLWDVGHSSPVYLGPPPSGSTITDKSLTEDGYASFLSSNAILNRTPSVFIGTNDGMVHAFNATNGTEMWAFVPYNLLAKLKLQRGVDADGNAYFNHISLVDGAVVVRDIYDRSAGRWRTVLITGQALGTGREDNNYYFALDVTDPTNPTPMWEYTDNWLAQDKSCTGQFSRQNCVTATPPPVCSCGSTAQASCGLSCNVANHRFVDAGLDQVTIEAENFNSRASLDSNDQHNWSVANSQTGFTGSGYLEATPTVATNCNNNYTTCGATARYQLQTDTTGTYRVSIRYSSANSNTGGFRVRVGSLNEKSGSLTNNGTWQWYTTTGTTTLSVSDYDLELFMVRDGLRIDRIILSTVATTSTTLAQTCANICVTQNPVTTCSTETFDPSQESFECGIGSTLKCCQDPSTQWYCSPVGQTCEDLDTVLGQTWSPPVVAPLKVNGTRQWNILFGSGYNNRTGVPAAVGRSVYAIDAVTGVRRGQWNYNDLPYNVTSNPSTIDNTMPGGVSVYDWTTTGTDEIPDGYADAAYIGDLEGRLWKIDLHDSGTPNGSTGVVSLSVWPTCVLFDAGSPTGSANRTWAPIITTPAVSLVKGDDIPQTFTARRPVVYFGTGGDDRAPSAVPAPNNLYRFYAVRDTVECSANSLPVYTGAKTAAAIYSTSLNPKHTEWIVGDNTDFNNVALTGVAVGSEGAAGQRYWSDPVIFNDSVVYFASLGGSIESVNPCNNLADSSLLYGYAIRDFSIADGTRFASGNSTIRVSGTTKAYLRSASKIRRSVLIGAQSPVAGVAQPPSTPASGDPTAGSKIYVQNFDGEVRTFDEPTVSDTNSVRVLRWREIPLK